MIVGEDGKPVGTIEDGDAVVLFNFRADRMVQISKAFEYEEFDAFDRKRFPKVHPLLERGRGRGGRHVLMWRSLMARPLSQKGRLSKPGCCLGWPGHSPIPLPLPPW